MYGSVVQYLFSKLSIGRSLAFKSVHFRRYSTISRLDLTFIDLRVHVINSFHHVHKSCIYSLKAVLANQFDYIAFPPPPYAGDHVARTWLVIQIIKAMYHTSDSACVISTMMKHIVTHKWIDQGGCCHIFALHAAVCSPFVQKIPPRPFYVDT